MSTISREPQLWTIGHSTKPIEDFLALLRSHGIRRLVDVRTIPRSRHNPQYDTEVLAAHLQKAKLMGVESDGMVLAGSTDGALAVLTVDRDLPPGAKVS